MREEKVWFPSRGGPKLEGLRFRGAEKEQGGVILCHPHPLYGGDMYNNVVTALQGSLVDAGLSTLRFNFRGVGGSEGGYGEGVREVEDVRGAVDFIADEANDPVYLAGYSFGAYVGVEGVLADERVKALACISPPLALYDFACLREDERPKLVVAGDEDFVCPLDKLEEVFVALREPKSLHIIPGADHFWLGFEDQLAAQVLGFLRDL